MALELPHVEVLSLVAVPALAAAIVALLGPDRRSAIRWISVLASCLTLLVAVSLTGRFMHLTMTQAREAVAENSVPTFRPEFVPGAYSDDRHATSWDVLPIGRNGPSTSAIQFFVGIDGLNIWLILLTAV